MGEATQLAAGLLAELRQEQAAARSRRSSFSSIWPLSSLYRVGEPPAADLDSGLASRIQAAEIARAVAEAQLRGKAAAARQAELMLLVQVR